MAQIRVYPLHLQVHMFTVSDDCRIFSTFYDVRLEFPYYIPYLISSLWNQIKLIIFHIY